MISRRVRSVSLLNEQTAEPSLDLSSLIDVSFLLLIYFLVTSTLMPREADLKTVVGGGTSSVDLATTFPEIQIDRLGGISYNGELLETDQSDHDLVFLSAKLLAYRKATDLTHSTAMVIIDADDDASGQRFIDVMNCLAHLGISNLAIREMSD